MTRDTIQCIQAATQNNIVSSVETTAHWDFLFPVCLMSTLTYLLTYSYADVDNVSSEQGMDYNRQTYK